MMKVCLFQLARFFCKATTLAATACCGSWQSRGGWRQCGRERPEQDARALKRSAFFFFTAKIATAYGYDWAAKLGMYCSLSCVCATLIGNRMAAPCTPSCPAIPLTLTSADMQEQLLVVCKQYQERAPYVGSNGLAGLAPRVHLH